MRSSTHTLVARVLNAPQLLHASMTTPPVAAAAAEAAGALSCAAFLATLDLPFEGASALSAALRLGAMLAECRCKWVVSVGARLGLGNVRKMVSLPPHLPVLQLQSRLKWWSQLHNTQQHASMHQCQSPSPATDGILQAQKGPSCAV